MINKLFIIFNSMHHGRNSLKLFVRFIVFACLTTLILIYISQNAFWSEFSGRILNSVLFSSSESLRPANSSFYGPSINLTCKFPILDPFDESILKHVKHPRNFNCSLIQPWISYITEDGFLVLNSTEIENSHFNSNCIYRTVSGGPPGNVDQKRTYSNWSSILPGEEVGVQTVAVEVQCSSVDEYGNTTVTYKNLHLFAPFLQEEMEASDERHLSVLIFGLESVSYGVYRRHLPSTYDYLYNSLDQLIFRGYTKIGDNTFPNMAAVLLGKRVTYSGPELPEEMGTNLSDIYFDDWNWIWKDFKKANYSTGFIEDAPHIGMFHYLKNGFRNPPTDWYSRPFFTARRISKLSENSSTHCFGNVPRIANNLDILGRILKRHHNHRYFLINFISSLSHDYSSPLEMADESFANFFREHSLYLKNTVVILMGDHGMRFGSIRATQIGLIEERMPVFSIILPKWFGHRYPKILENLRMNQWRLASPFDAFQTLKDIAAGNFEGKQMSENSRSQSLLYPIPLDRNCESAQIPSIYCTCANYAEIAVNDSIVHEVAEFLVQHVNQLVQAQYSEKCAILTLQTIDRAAVYETSQDVIQGYKSFANKKKGESDIKNSPKPSKVNQYQLSITVAPSGAMLEGLVLHNLATNHSAIHNQISRINKYGSQSSCVKDAVMKLYCYCSPV